MFGLVVLFLGIIIVFILFGCFFNAIFGHHVLSVAQSVGYLLDVLIFGIIGIIIGFLSVRGLDKHFDNKKKKEDEQYLSQIP